MSALQHVQELDQSADVYLYELKGYSQSNPESFFRFTNYAGVSFNGPWVAIACACNSMEITSTSTQPRLELTVSDTLGTVGALMNSIDGAIEGSKLKIIRTKARFLDSGATPSTTNGILQQSNLIITQISSFIPGEAIVIVGSNPVDYGGGETACPSRVATVKCPGTVTYRGSYCTYSGAAMFDLANQPTLDPLKDQCSKSIAGCRARFGPNATLPFGGFPTLQRR
jgi:lambda family phage minor tail protein L